MNTQLLAEINEALNTYLVWRDIYRNDLEMKRDYLVSGDALTEAKEKLNALGIEV